MTEDLFSVARKTKEKVEREMISKLGIGSIFEGVGNIINIIGRITEEGSISQEKNIKNEKTPVSSRNSQ